MGHRILFTYNKNTPAETIYGYLYNWWAAIGDTDGDFSSNQDIASTGWHVPTQTEWDTLINYVGGKSVAGRELKSTGTEYWLNNNGLDTYGFSAPGAGQRISSFDDIKEVGTFWTSTTAAVSFKTGKFNSATNASNSMTQSGAAAMKEGKSVRLIKDSTTLLHGQTGTYQGNDGKIYPTICIGTQEWLSVNLEETKWRTGGSIPEIGWSTAEDAAWVSATSAAMCIP